MKKDPSPCEIACATARIRAKWKQKTLQSRAGTNRPVRWELPFIRTCDIPSPSARAIAESFDERF